MAFGAGYSLATISAEDSAGVRPHRHHHGNCQYLGEDEILEGGVGGEETGLVGTVVTSCDSHHHILLGESLLRGNVAETVLDLRVRVESLDAYTSRWGYSRD